MRALLPALTVLCLLAPARAQQPDFDPVAAMKEAITKVKGAALKTAETDWGALEPRLLAAASKAKDQVDLLPLYDTLLLGLQDGHSFVKVDPRMHQAFRDRYGYWFNKDHVYRPAASTFTKRSQPSSREVVVGKRTAGLVEIPGYGGQANDVRAYTYASAIHSRIAAMAPVSCGLIVDLRGNTGGNMWPMLAGTSSLLGRETVLQGLDRHGQAGTLTRAYDGASRTHVNGKDYPVTQVDRSTPAPDLSQLPVAVLIDDGVASSGEAVAIAFHGRPATRFFGQRTYGQATMNQGMQFGDVMLLVTVSHMADRNRQTFPEGVEPDVGVDYAAPQEGRDDTVVEAAKAWLATLPGCAG